MKTKTKRKDFLTIGEVAVLLNCTEANIYNSIKTGSLTTIEKATYIQGLSGESVETGEIKKYITRQSIEDKQSGINKKPKKGKQIKAEYIGEWSWKTFENGKSEIVFPSETVAAKKLKIKKFALRYRLANNVLIDDKIRVSKVI